MHWHNSTINWLCCNRLASSFDSIFLVLTRLKKKFNKELCESNFFRKDNMILRSLSMIFDVTYNEWETSSKISLKIMWDVEVSPKLLGMFVCSVNGYIECKV